MAKKKGGKSKGAVSRGQHSNVSRKVLNALRSDYLQSNDRLLNQMQALKNGKDVVITIENPNKQETNKRFIKQRITAAQYRARFDFIKKKDTANVDS